MPELPEVEITARLLHRALKGAVIESALAPGINALKTFDPPLSALEGQRIIEVGRRGKHLIIETAGGLALLIHLMGAGRLQLYDRPAGPRDRSSRLLVRVRADRGAAPAPSIEGSPEAQGESLEAQEESTEAQGGSPEAQGESTAAQGESPELRLREFGTRQAAWVKLLRAGELERDDALATLGPEAWPDPPPLKDLLDAPRPLHALLRDQRVIAGIGRSWVDEILWYAKRSPYKRGADLDADEAEGLRDAVIETLGGAIAHYQQAVRLPIPDKLPMPLRVHRHQGEPCPRCATTLRSVHFEDYVIAYCPACQTDGRVLKDRRLSRLLR